MNCSINHPSIGVIITDLQGDFTTLKKGSLAVQGTDQTYVDQVDQTVRFLMTNGMKVFATQDWHPPEHISFFTNNPGTKPFDMVSIKGRPQVMWPPHCVQNSENAQLLIDKDLVSGTIQKGTDPNFDSYSGFKDDGGKETGLGQILGVLAIEKLVVFGLTTDYCVRATAMDAAALGYKVIVIENLCKGVAPDTTAEAIQEMKEKDIFILPQIDLNTIVDL